MFGYNMFIDIICRFYFSCCLLTFAVFSDPLYLHLGVVVIIKGELGMWSRRGKDRSLMSVYIYCCYPACQEGRSAWGAHRVLRSRYDSLIFQTLPTPFRVHMNERNFALNRFLDSGNDIDCFNYAVSGMHIFCSVEWLNEVGVDELDGEWQWVVVT